MTYTFKRLLEKQFLCCLVWGKNRKTAFTNVLTAMHGVENVSNVPLSEMLSNKFALSDLENKGLNIDN